MPSFPRSSTERYGMWDFLTEHWRDGVEIIILAALAYHGYLFFRATRGARILTGLLILLLSLALISLLLELSVISGLLQRFSVFLAIALVIIFQPELRRVLAELGSSRIFSFNRPDPEALDVLMEAMQQLSSRRCGALFALKRGIDLKPYAESGIELDAVISVELITTIFHPKTSLHDGGMIIDQGRIAAAGCVFPVSQRDVQDRAIGLRHRAGMGISDETDAIALAVSEESGALSLCYQGRLEHDLEPDELRNRINEILNEGSGTGAAEPQQEGGHELGSSI
ncbi:diadenylate cyclase CdaA [Prosthecobacter sp.]|uniref:diadenylate cyclase CdaA n=1 Tax=Prosthecobacter sp. TaxID=1965333 RepID=UPI002ABB2F5F|nr:diadenylate cyclase CdaA [Prosthecobacter sp.]MDZ4401349.1 diadenylate cyclase CdaA [Prosthecobacter sp.]